MTTNEKDALKGLLQEYELLQPVPDDFKGRISSRMEGQFKEVLKKTGQYSLAYGFFLSIYFFFKKKGLFLYLMKIIISLFTAASVSLGTYVVYNKINYGTWFLTENKIVNENLKAGFINQIELIPFKGSAEAELFSIVEGNIIKEINRLKGKGFSIRRIEPSGNASKILLGSIDMAGENIVIFYKVVSVEDSKILYAGHNEISPNNDIDGICRGIAENIVSAIK